MLCPATELRHMGYYVNEPVKTMRQMEYPRGKDIYRGENIKLNTLYTHYKFKIKCRLN